MIGDFGLMGNGAAGIKIDRAVVGLGAPPHALVVASSVGEYSDIYRVTLEDLEYNSPVVLGTMSDLVRADMVWADMVWADMVWADMVWADMVWADMVFFETANGGGVWADMVFFETANGGGVFSVGSITWCAALGRAGA